MTARAHRLGTLSLLAFALACASVVQAPQWAQTSYYLLTQSLANGSVTIDSHHWQTGDKSWYRGHFHSVKAPGMPMLLVPPFLLLRTAGINPGGTTLVERQRASRRHAREGMRTPRPAWARSEVHRERWMIWALGLFGSVLPALGLLWLVRSDTERLLPGAGAASAVAIGMGTMILPFATQLFGHVLGAFLVYLAFHVLMRERRGSASPRLLALAGLAAGFAITVEYPMALAALILGVYALMRQPRSLTIASRRAAAFGVGALGGLIPLAVYNAIAFGSVTHLSYGGAVAVEGRSGHARLGLNDSGFFGIGVPDPISLVDILLSPRGLLTATPICAVALIGLWWMRRRTGFRSEASIALAIIAAYLLYVAGYWLPFGGESPGPRFLVVILPFLALGLPAAWQRIPSATLALAGAGATVMAVATVAGPLVTRHSLGSWGSRMLGAPLFKSVFTVIGLPPGKASAIPVLLILIAAAVLAGLATRLDRFAAGNDLWVAIGVLCAWLVLALVVSPAIGEREIDRGLSAVGLPANLVAVAAITAVAAVAIPLAVRRSGRLSTRPSA